jgi:hypothetical protein
VDGSFLANKSFVHTPEGGVAGHVQFGLGGNAHTHSHMAHGLYAAAQLFGKAAGSSSGSASGSGQVSGSAGVGKSHDKSAASAAVSQSQSDLKADYQSDSQAQLDAQSQSDSQSAYQSDSQSQAQSHAQAQSQAQTQIEAEAASKPHGHWPYWLALSAVAAGGIFGISSCFLVEPSSHRKRTGRSRHF